MARYFPTVFQVSNGNRWLDVMEAMGLSAETGVGEHAIRVIYMR